MAKNKKKNKFIASMLATTLIAGAGMAGGMAIQNAYADPNAGGDIDRLQTELVTEQTNHEITKAELANVQAELETEKAKDVQDETRIAELEAKVAELEQQLQREDSKLYFDELYSEVPDVRIAYLDKDNSLVYAVGYGGVYLMSNTTFTLTRVSIQGGSLEGCVDSDKYVLIYSASAGMPSFVYEKETQMLSEIVLDFHISGAEFVNGNTVVLHTFGDGEFSILWDLETNTEIGRTDKMLTEISLLDGDLYLIRDNYNNYYVGSLDLNNLASVAETPYDGATEETSWYYELYKIKTEDKVVEFFTQNMMTGEIKVYIFNYETMNGSFEEVMAVYIDVYSETDEYRQTTGAYARVGVTIAEWFENNPTLGTTSADQFRKFAIDYGNGELVEVEPTAVLDNSVVKLHVYW